jgi:hypothetical protein
MESSPPPIQVINDRTGRGVSDRGSGTPRAEVTRPRPAICTTSRSSCAMASATPQEGDTLIIKTMASRFQRHS